ncbi:MAG: aerobic carbon-monoxide dehydrogenase medium subunit [Actinomycetota bacterium]|nr:aerobic carbon-monoxide dehydrogenase medium subunit [Actinomycetota bacterium]
MYPGRFAYHLPDSLPEAVRQLERGGGDARALAGGQSLMRLMRFRYESPSHLVDLRNLGLSGIDELGGRLRIGATTTDTTLETSPTIREHYPLLADVSRVIADPLIRNLGTIGGSAAYAHPSGDWGPALIAARATFISVGPGGQRSIPADQFFVGSFCTALGPAEILTAIEMSGLADGGGAYMKLHRKIGDFATVGVGVQLKVDAEGKVSDCGIGMAGIGLSYVRASKAEEYLVGRTLDRDTLRRGSGIAAEETHPVKDTRGSAIYKREMVKVLCGHALETAAVRAGYRVEA